MTVSLHPLPDAAEAYFTSDPAYLAERADWLRHRYEGHLEQAHRYRTLAARDHRWGYLDMAAAHTRNAEYHERRAEDFRRKLA